MRTNKIFGLFLSTIVFLYIALMAYFCYARPNEPNIIIERKFEIEKTSTPKAPERQESVEAQEYKNTVNDLTANQYKIVEDKTTPTTSIGVDVYLCEITSFYERVITILSVIIGLILGLNFLYIHVTSKKQAEEMAREALKDESFEIKLEKVIETCFTKSIREGDIADFGKELEDIDGRLEFLEKAITKTSFELNEPSEGETDGNN